MSEPKCKTCNHFSPYPIVKNGHGACLDDTKLIYSCYGTQSSVSRPDVHEDSTCSNHEVAKSGVMNNKVTLENPLENIVSTLVFSPKDMSECRRDAWIYGIAVGWDEESLYELKGKHDWSDEDVARLKRLHERYKELLEFAKIDIGDSE